MKKQIIILNFIFISAQLIFPINAAPAVTPEILFDSALENNMELQKLAVDTNIASIDKKNAEAAAFPTVDFQTTLTYQTNPMIEPITLTAGELGAYDIGGSPVLLPAEDVRIYDGMENTWYEFKLTVDQPVFTWGKISNSIKLTDSLLKTSILRRESKMNDLKTRIYTYSYSLFYIGKIEEILSRQASEVSRLITIAEESYRNGFILYSELLEAKIQAKKLDIAEMELIEQKEATLLMLSQLSGIKDININDFDFSFIRDITVIETLAPEFYLNKVAAANPDILMLNSLRQINDLKLKISEGSAYLKPDIALHFELGYSGPRFPFIETDWFGKDSLGLNSTLALKTRIFDGGMQSYKIEKDMEDQRKAFYEYELGLETITHFISERLLKIDLSRQNIEYYQLLQENERQQIEMQKRQIDAGSGNETEMIKKKINLNNNIISEYNESIEFFKNYYSLLGTACPDEKRLW